MKLLGWMHRKLKQNSVEPFKEFKTGNAHACLSTQPSIYEQQYYPKPAFSSENSRQNQGGCQKSSAELKTKRLEETCGEDLSIGINAPFDGFLTIGTLGSEPIITEPPTPTFPMPFETITEKATEVTKNEVKLINEELEKFLEAEAKEVGDDSSERSSHVSTITICGKKIEGVDTEECGENVVCPLQGYLFGSSIELTETSIEVKKERTSLGQLFKSSNITYDHFTNKCEKWENHAKGTSAMGIFRKMLKKFHSSSRSSAASSACGSAVDPVSTKKKLPKVLRMFHKKVHPERSPGEEKFTESHTCEIKKYSIDGGYNKGSLALDGKHNRRSPLKATLKKEFDNFDLSFSSNLTHKRGHWIKTDANYLVLEL